jgi:hypothetical protein
VRFTWVPDKRCALSGMTTPEHILRHTPET